ncbi:hypothetical protein KJ910_03940 [Patescibacteria group bacterium]|nr:hypothetical protein [Patescibacteria group bacterium]MBU1906997.1 hypothetical protein [Patescibacteria group bacterium]
MKRKPLVKGSATQKELNRLVQKLQLLERKSVYQTRAEWGDFGLKAQRRSNKMSGERWKKYQQVKAQKRLVEQELIHLDEIGDAVVVKLSTRGRVEALKNRICETKKQLTKGRACLVIFDIPEHVRNVRWCLRSILKEAGFQNVQLSVWKTEKDIIHDFRELIGELKISDWVQVYVAKQH